LAEVSPFLSWKWLSYRQVGRDQSAVAGVAVTDYRIGASFSVSLSCLRAPARMFRSE
jgi:hypothetical protein